MLLIRAPTLTRSITNNKISTSSAVADRALHTFNEIKKTRLPSHASVNFSSPSLVQTSTIDAKYSSFVPTTFIAQQSFISSLSLTIKRKFSALPEESCPFRELNITRETTYAAAKKVFLNLAMQNHPDVMNQRFAELDLTEEEMEKKRKSSAELFMRARSAFEAIVESDDGLCVLRIELEAEKELMSNEEFDAWFLNETGHNNPYQFDLDPATMREVAEMTESMGGGLDRDGGMWTLARMVSSSVKTGKESANTLRLEAGEIRPGEKQITLEGTLRRRRTPARSGRSVGRF